jgi:membrane-bound lytic murein transglycosylase D
VPAAGAERAPAILGTEAAPPVEAVVEAPTLHEDLWTRVRQNFGVPDIDSDLVRKWEQFYVARPDYLARMFERGGRYLYHIVDEVTKRGMPTELALLPFIESAFNPQALSASRASGIWQFMPATGQHFELRQNLFRDDRRSVLDSTRAALDYLEQLHRKFGDWQLALAAYNWGQGNVMRAQDANRRKNLDTGYADLRMPDETRNYVPKLQAFANLVERPGAFGLALPPLENHPYFLTVNLDRDIDVALVARLAGISVEDFQALNPQLNKPVILAAGTPQLLLPFEAARRYQRGIERHPGPFATWTAWVAPRTLTVRDAASHAGMTEAQLRDVNRIPPRMLIKAGSTLLVPRRDSRQSDVSEKVADTASISLAAEVPAGRRKLVNVGAKAQSVAALARRHRVSAAQLARWNGLGEKDVLRAGQQFVLYVSPAKRPASSTRTTAETKGTGKVVAGKPRETRKAAAPAPRRRADAARR